MIQAISSRQLIPKHINACGFICLGIQRLDSKIISVSISSSIFNENDYHITVISWQRNGFSPNSLDHVLANNTGHMLYPIRTKTFLLKYNPYTEKRTKYDVLLDPVVAIGACEHGFPSQIARFMGPTWRPPGSWRPQMGSMLATWTLLSLLLYNPSSSYQETMKSNWRRRSSRRVLGL